MTRVSHGLDRVDVIFDEPHLVANAGLLLVASLTGRLGLEALIDSTVHLVGRVGGARPGRKVLTLVHAMVGGGSHIDHADMLRAGSTAAVLGHRVMAPSTLGTFLRAFTFGHVRQLEAVIGRAIERAWAAGAGPGSAAMTIDVDSTICDVHGDAKQGAAYGYTKTLGYHPLLATRADTGEVLHARMRKGSANTQRGVQRFATEVVARLRRAGASGPLTVRGDAGFYGWELIKTLNRLGVAWSITVTMNPSIRAAINAIDESDWTDIAYPDGGAAQVAEITYISGGGLTKRAERHVRLVVRRTRLTDPAQAQLWPEWRHHAFVTNIELPTVEADQFHRRHAVVELAIRDLKEGAGLDHVPSGNFHANSAWLQCAVLAHNLIRWTAILGNVRVDDELTVARTMRTRLISLPGRLVNHAGRLVLRLPERWPWANTFTTALDALRLLRPAPT